MSPATAVGSWTRQARLRLGDDLLATPALMFCLALIAMGALRSDAFLSTFNIGNVLVQVTPLLLVAVGQTFAVASGGLDLSVGGVVSLSAVVAAVTFGPLGVLGAVTLGLAAGVLLGALNGYGVSLGLEPFLVTLGSFSVAQGVALLVRPTPGGEVPLGFAQLARFWGPLPVALPAVLLVVALAVALLRRGRLGIRVLAVGGDTSVARLSGVPVRRTQIAAYAFSAFMAALAAVFLVARTRTGDPTIGAAFTLDSLAATVLGGTILGGGRATVVGSVLGALALGLLANVLNLLGVPAFYQLPLKGGLVIAAVLLPSLLARWAIARRRRRMADDRVRAA